MDPTLLEPAEFNLECELRNILGLTAVKVSMLKYVLEQEASKEQKEPSVAHEAARKNPRRELAFCAGKIVEIQESLMQMLPSNSQHKLLMVKAMKSRALHYRYRLSRISASPCLRDEFDGISNLCEQLIKVLNNSDDTDANNLNDTLSTLQEVDSSAVKIFIDKDRVENSATGTFSNDEKSVVNPSHSGIIQPSTSTAVQQLSGIGNLNQMDFRFPPPTTICQLSNKAGLPIVSSGNPSLNSQNNNAIPSSVCNPNDLQQLNSMLSKLNLLNVPLPLKVSEAPVAHLPVENSSVSQPNPQTAVNPSLQNNLLNVNQLSMLLSQLNENNIPRNLVVNPVSNSVPVASSPHPEVNDFGNRPNSLGQELNSRHNYNIHK